MQIQTLPITPRSLLSVLLCVAGLVCGSQFALAAEKPESCIPFNELDAATQARVREVVPDYTFYRKIRLPHPVAQARQPVFEYLLNHLEETTHVAQKLGIVNFLAQRRPDGSYWASNHKGAEGYLWFLHSAPGRRLCFVQGVEQGSKTVSGRAVVLLSYREQEPGRMCFELQAFCKVDNWLKAALTIVFWPFVVGTVDGRFSDAVDVPVLVSERACVNPAKVLSVVDALPPEQRERLKDLRKMLTSSTSQP